MKPWMIGAIGGSMIGLTVDNTWQLVVCLLGAILIALAVAVAANSVRSSENDT